MKKIIFFLAFAAGITLFSSCSKSSNSPTVSWSATISMSAKFEVPAPAGRNETATAELQLFSDNMLKYNITVNNLTAGDALTAAHIHLGNAGVSGGVYIPFNGTFSGSNVSGTVQLTAGQADTVKNGETYVNVHSTQVGGGLVRGQIDSKVVFAADIALNGASEVPAVNTTATGLAIIRMTENKKIYVKVTVSNLEAGDALTFAHFHSGSSTVSGPVVLGFYSAAADFGTLKILTADAAFYNSLLTDALYVNTHSTAHPAGLIRGQIR
jgi:hypothetical protein